jgi:ribosomal protein S27AE
MREINEDGRLLAAHRQRLIVGSALLAFSAILTLFPETLGNLVGVSAWWIELTGAILFFALLYWLASGMKCPGCGANLFWYGLGHAKYGDWLNWMFKQSACPKCGHRPSAPTASRTGRS